jgi:prepilin-type N-terminal cleavage/methylation domain-containing protein
MKEDYTTPSNRRAAEAGFSLIELMIVIAIIGILIAVGVTGWKAAVKQANEAAAVKTIRTISEQQMLYYNGHNRSTFGTFEQMLKDGMLDARFSNGTTPVVEGYVFSLKVIQKSTGQPASYTINADPQQSEGVGATGKNHFYSDSNASTIHVNADQPAAPTDPPLGQ